MLDICKNFFTHLGTSKIRYCHWKSNEHLDAALSGKTDLDLLVHDEDRELFEQALTKFQIKKIMSPPDKQFPGLEDYLGFDYETAKFVHIHVHYRLVLGQKYIKNHHLPIENLFFDNLIIKKDVFIPCPELELILLIIRAHMKVDLISIVKHAIKDMASANYTAFPSDIENELSELISCSDIKKLKNLLTQSGLPIEEKLLIEFINNFKNHDIKFYNIIFTQLEILRSIKDFRRSKSIFVYANYFIFFVAELPMFRYLKTFKRKTIPGGGKVISIVGADGSGKSTLIKDLEKWLAWKLFVKRYYYGIPKDTVSKIAFLMIRGFNKFHLKILASFIEVLYWTHVARVRRAISYLSRRDAAEGKIVISDRFPLKQFQHMAEPMDGPRLFDHGGYWAEYEVGCYEDIKLPDRIFILQVKLEELRKRKTDISLENHQIKANAVNNICEQEPFILIDASKPYDQVLLQVKRLIWDII